MKREDISEAVGNISTKYIQEAAPKSVLQLGAERESPSHSFEQM